MVPMMLVVYSFSIQYGVCVCDRFAGQPRGWPPGKGFAVRCEYKEQTNLTIPKEEYNCE